MNWEIEGFVVVVVVDDDDDGSSLGWDSVGSVESLTTLIEKKNMENEVRNRPYQGLIMRLSYIDGQ